MLILKAKDKFLDSCRMKMLSQRTISNYDEFINRFIAWSAYKDLYYLDRELVDDYRLYLVKIHCSPSTVGTYLRHLKVFLKWLYEYEYIDNDFYKHIKIPKQRKKVVELYDECQIQSIFNIVFRDGYWLGVRNALLVSLMLDSGLRLNETVSIKYDDFDFNHNILLIHGKGDKERLVPIGKFSKKLLKEYQEKCPFDVTGHFVLNQYGKPLTNNAVKLMVNKLSRELGFRFSPHKLRHNFATNYCIDSYRRTGQVDIYKLMVLLGHEDIRTTRIYLHMANQIIVSRNQISHLDLIGIG